MVHILISSSRPKSSLNQLKIFLIELFSLDRIIDFESFEGFHHICWLQFVSSFCKHWRDDNLKIASNGYKRAMWSIQIWMIDKLKWILIILEEFYLIFVDVIIFLEGIIDDLHVVE